MKTGEEKMNLQTLSIILIIIVLPITLILSAYTKVQIDTLALQTMCKTQLKNATYDAMVAFQLNTVHNNYSTVSDSMRRDISAVIQSFISSMANNMGISGATEATIKPYIPAIVFTLYDGYYIYSPSSSYYIDDNGVEQKKYEHVLKPYIYYTARYIKGDTDIVVNYTLDNYVVITGNVEGVGYVSKAGYLIADGDKIEVNNETLLERRLPVTTIIYPEPKSEDVNTSNESYTYYTYDTELADVYVSNEGMLASRLENGKYLTNTDLATKLFKDPTQLSINNETLLQDPNRENIGKINITSAIIDKKASLMNNSKYYKEILDKEGKVIGKKYYKDILLDAGKKEADIIEKHNIGFYVDPSTDEYYIQANSAQQYYDEAKVFTDWVNQHLVNIQASDAVRVDGTKIDEGNYEYIFQISTTNDPEAEESKFTDHRREVIKSSIQDNLSQAILSYNMNSEALGTIANFQMPILTDVEWDKVLKNVCLITFMQGIQVGTKVFNDYCIVTSTKNKEYVPADSLYFVNTEDEDGNETRRWILS